jgi:protein-L-isoaspartate(D-aspartate) O-methyltransferase
MVDQRDDLAEARAVNARETVREGGSTDPRLERAFELVPRELFVGPPPWRIIDVREGHEELTGDPQRLYRDALVVLDEA